ncbi:MAG TPA: hypothetical protein VII76_11355 [Acidimicrobiales bacterium]
MPSAETLLQAFRERFSEPRMALYGDRAGWDPDLTIKLYEWNLRIGGAFLADLGVVEVLLRNAFDQVLREEYPPRQSGREWYDQSSVLFDPEGKLVDKAKKDAQEYADDESPDHDAVVAALSFGFWRSLLLQRYQQRLWPTLEKAFFGVPAGIRVKRVDAEDRVKNLVALRNAIAHHDPIFDLPLEGVFQQAKTVAGHISPPIQVWMTERSQVPALLKEHPIPRLLGTWPLRS